LHGSLYDKLDLLLGRRAAGIALDGPTREGTEAEIAALVKYARTIGMSGKPKTFPKESAITKEMGIPRLYLLYEWASSHVHATSQAIEPHVEHGEGVMQVSVKTDDLPTWVGVAAISADQLSAGHVAAAMLLNFNTVGEVLAFRDHVKAKTSELMSASGVTIATPV
jgi:hypothetical protein